MDRKVLVVWDADNIKTKNESIPTAFLGLQKKLIENNLILHKVFVCGYENSSGVRELMKNLENFGGFRCCPIFRGRNGDEADQKIIIEMGMFALENPQGAIVLISDDTDYVQFASDLYRKAFPLYWAVFNDENFPERILWAAKEIWGWKKLCTDDEPPPASQPIPSVPLWLDYLRRSVQENRSPSGMRYLFELALVVCDSSDADYKKIWESYREFEQSRLTEETNTYGVKRIQILFDRQLCQPLADVRASLLSYKSWEVEHHMLFPQPSCTISEKVHFHIMWDVTKCEVSKNVADKPKWRHIPSVLRDIVGEYFRLPGHSTGEIFVRLISRWAKDIDREMWRSQVECLYSGLGPKNSTTKLLVSCIAGALVETSPSKTVLIILSDGKDHCQEDLSNLLLRLDMQGYKRLTIMPNSSQSEHWSSINAVVHDWKDVKRRVGITS